MKNNYSDLVNEQKSACQRIPWSLLSTQREYPSLVGLVGETECKFLSSLLFFLQGADRFQVLLDSVHVGGCLPLFTPSTIGWPNLPNPGTQYQQDFQAPFSDIAFISNKKNLTYLILPIMVSLQKKKKKRSGSDLFISLPQTITNRS